MIKVDDDFRQKLREAVVLSQKDLLRGENPTEAIVDAVIMALFDPERKFPEKIQALIFTCHDGTDEDGDDGMTANFVFPMREDPEQPGHVLIKCHGALEALRIGEATITKTR